MFFIEKSKRKTIESDEIGTKRDIFKKKHSNCERKELDRSYHRCNNNNKNSDFPIEKKVVEMSRQRPTPTGLELNVQSISDVVPTATTLLSSNQRDKSSQRMMHDNKSVMMNLYQQQMQKKQQTLVKTRTMHATSMTTSTTSSSSASSFPINSERLPKTNHWQDELMAFSTQITRDAQNTLMRIANHFRVNGMKFDTNFRNHFLYITNNR